MPPIAPQVSPVVLDRSWWSFAGPHGGHVASHLLEAATRLTAHPPRSMHVQLSSAAAEGPADVQAVLVREGRSALFADVTLRSGGEIRARASVVLGDVRPGPAVSGPTPPQVGPPEDIAELEFPREFVPFAQHLEYRPSAGQIGAGQADVHSWVRFRDGRMLDAAAATVLVDAMPPALYGKLPSPVPIPTADLYVSFSVATAVDGWSLLRIATRTAADGWCVDDSEVWTRDGLLLASGRQTRLVLDGAA